MILDKINSVEDVKKLRISELETLSEELRNFIIDITSKTGGHVAPNLGVVELTLALHYKFNSPDDKIIWDVGHQCYIHKIITDRKDKMESIRQYGGISGFPKREESPHDILNTGHSSTSIAVACGIAQARDLNKENFYIIPVIGDGALTGGVALEGLNFAGESNFKQFIIVLNDNEMSISENVGAFSKYLRKVRLDVAPLIYQFKSEIKRILKIIPSYGNQFFNFFEHLRSTLKNFFIPGAIFQDLGYEYIGPVDGHDFKELFEAIDTAKLIKDKPVLLHVNTVKGKGYEPAMKKPELFHGLGPYDPETGEPVKSSLPSYSEFFSDCLIQEAKENKNIIAVVAAMAEGTGLIKFKNSFPERFFDVGIAEQCAVDFAVGLALEGYKVVVDIYSTFIQRAYDQVIHDVALQNLPIIFVLDRAGIVGEDGPTHHGIFDLSFMRAIPNLVIMAPADEVELQEMLKLVLKLNKPSVIRIPRGKITGNKYEISEFDLGKGSIVKEGEKIALLSIGTMLERTKKAAKIIEEKEKITPGIYNARFAKPIDKKLIENIALKYKILVTIEDNTIIGGFGSSVNEHVIKLKKIIPVLNIGIEDEFPPHGKMEDVYNAVGLSPEKIADKVLEFYKRK